MAAEKRAEHEPGDKDVVTDAIKYVGPVRNQLAVDPHPQHAVIRPGMISRLLLAPNAAIALV